MELRVTGLIYRDDNSNIIANTTNSHLFFCHKVSNPGCTTYYLCNIGQVTYLLLALLFSSNKLLLYISVPEMLSQELPLSPHFNRGCAAVDVSVRRCAHLPLTPHPWHNHLNEVILLAPDRNIPVSREQRKLPFCLKLKKRENNVSTNHPITQASY